MSDTWNGLVRQHGRKSVMSLAISNLELDAETARQIPILREAIRPYLTGKETSALDFGCGYGRFTPMLANLINGRAVGFDPSEVMIREGSEHIFVDRVTCPTDQFFHEISRTGTKFDLILAFGVLGEPTVTVWTTALNLCRSLSDDGLLVIVDHVVPNPDPRLWWRFQRPGYYEDVFRACGVDLNAVGTVAQLTDVMTIYAGRMIG